MSSFTILFLAANPSDTTRVQTNTERQRIEAEILKSPNREGIHLVYEPAVQPKSLIEVFRQHRPQVVHFSGHGSSENEVVLETDDGRSRLVGADVLEELFRLQGEGVRVVLLNACYSGKQAAGLLRHVPCAIGMNRAIPDKTAVDFATAFYQGLAFGESVRKAFDSSLLQLRLLDPCGGASDSRPISRRDLVPTGSAEERTIPELLERVQGVADRIFLLDRPAVKLKVPGDLGPATTDQVDAQSVPGLKAALDFLFGEGHEILQEIKKRRRAQGRELEPTGVVEGVNRVQGKDNCLKEPISSPGWLASEPAVAHLMQLLKIDTRNYRHAQKMYALWTEALAPAIVMNTLEEAEDAMAADYPKLHEALNLVFGKTVVVA